MKSLSQRLASPVGLIALAATMLAVLFVSNALFRGWRIDLTENNLYSVSDGTRNILKAIDEPLNFYFFFSDTTAGDSTGLRLYAQRVREVLEEFALEADGKIHLEVIDPLPFSEEEDQAAQFGLQAVPLQNSGDTIYFGLAGTNALDDQMAIPFFYADKESFLEYDLAKLVHQLSNPKRPVIGLLSTLPMSAQFSPATMRQEPGWMLTDQLGQMFDLRTLDQTATSIGDEIDVLMLVHPKALAEETLYAIDQFVVGGGHALIFVDPYAEIDQPPQDPNNPAAMFTAVRSSTMPKLFDAWGIEFEAGKFVADDRYALQLGGGPGGPVRHLGYLGLDSAALDDDDVITGDLDSINIGYAGALSVADGASVTLTPLLQSSDEAALMDISKLMFLQDPNTLRPDFAADGTRHTLAARMTGPVASAFPDGPPGGADAAGHVSASERDANVIIVTDVDMLTDRFWVRVQNFFNQRLASPFANNADLVFNALDNLTGNADLISIRGRATYRRPFERVDELNRRAEERFRATEERLQQELQQTEQRLGELQSNRDDSNTLIITDEQRQEIDSFLDKKLRIRKELRQVRGDLNKDITRLGNILKAINILAVPLLVVVFAVVMGVRRTRRAARQRGQ